MFGGYMPGVPTNVPSFFLPLFLSPQGMLVNITGGADMTLFEVDKAAQKITEEVMDESANIIFGSAFDSSMEGQIRVSIVATGIEEATW